MHKRNRCQIKQNEPDIKQFSRDLLKNLTDELSIVLAGKAFHNLVEDRK